MADSFERVRTYLGNKLLGQLGHLGDALPYYDPLRNFDSERERARTPEPCLCGSPAGWEAISTRLAWRCRGCWLEVDA